MSCTGWKICVLIVFPNVMSLKWYELIRHYLHTNDNTEKKDDPSRLFKVELVIQALRTNCHSIEQEQYQSINEQMVLAKTKRSGICQYLTNKEDSQVGIQKLCSGRCLWNHLQFLFL